MGVSLQPALPARRQVGWRWPCSLQAPVALPGTLLPASLGIEADGLRCDSRRPPPIGNAWKTLPRRNWIP